MLLLLLLLLLLGMGAKHANQFRARRGQAKSRKRLYMSCKAWLHGHSNPERTKVKTSREKRAENRGKKEIATPLRL